MPKDKTKNIDRYKIQGGVINEYEYHQNQGALAQNRPRVDDDLMFAPTPDEEGEGLQPTVAETATKSGPQKSTKSTKTKKAKTSSKKASNATKAPKSMKVAVKK